MDRKEKYILVRNLYGKNGSIGIATEKLDKDPLPLVVRLNQIYAAERIMILYTTGGWNHSYEPVKWQNTEETFIEAILQYTKHRNRR